MKTCKGKTDADLRKTINSFSIPCECAAQLANELRILQFFLLLSFNEWINLSQVYVLYMHEVTWWVAGWVTGTFEYRDAIENGVDNENSLICLVECKRCFFFRYLCCFFSCVCFISLCIRSILLNLVAFILFV